MSIENKRVVVYVAHSIVRDVTLFRLELLGIHAIGVGSDEEMQAELAAAVPDAVVFDLDLDDGAGLRWTEKIAADECTSHVPILCFSSRGDLQEAEDAFRAGARGFLIVPFDPIVFEDKLLNLIQQAQNRPVAERLLS
ncbi:MAG: response regulator [Pirellulaceae bacterium]